VLTSPKHGSSIDGMEEIEGIRYYRTASMPADAMRNLPFAWEIRLMARLGRRIAAVAKQENVDLIHCHSPLLNGLPALWVARRLKIPLVYEARAFWEDAAVDHGTFAEGSFRWNVDLPMTGCGEEICFRAVAGGLKVARSLNEVSRERTRLDIL
jgi:glycogen synthase